MSKNMRKRNKNKTMTGCFDIIRPTLKKKYLMPRDIFFRYLSLIMIVAFFPVFDNIEDINNPELSHMVVIWKLPFYLLIVTCALIFYLWRVSRCKYYKIVKVTNKKLKSKHYYKIVQCFSFNKSLGPTDKSNWVDLREIDEQRDAMIDFDRLTMEKEITETVVESSKIRIKKMGVMEFFKYIFNNKFHINLKYSRERAKLFFGSKSDGMLIVYALIFMFFYIVNFLVDIMFTMDCVHLIVVGIVLFYIFKVVINKYNGDLRIIKRDVRQGLCFQSTYHLQLYLNNDWCDYRITHMKYVSNERGKGGCEISVEKYDKLLTFFNKQTLNENISIAD
ncbi:hypothetical protein [Marinicellulosiphila megalodicopiae]|uniref:hypothetical protein n=1 Tax=Marinicellulosiphila megalodicopiae TaxID=2724896 RepID=UPI003BB15925